MDAVRSVPVDGRCFKESRGEFHECLGDQGLGGGVLLEVQTDLGDVAWGAAPGMVEGLGASMCAQDGSPKSTGMSHQQLRARLAETSVKYLHSL